MFYVYSRIYEPAEGGYYAETSKVDECYEYEAIKDAMNHFLSWLDFVEQQGCNVYFKQPCVRTVESKVFQLETLEEPIVKSWTAYPWARYDTKNIGDGFSIEVSDMKPKDEGYY